MPQRTAGATNSQILLAFGESRTWVQKDLAKRCGVGVRALRERLDELKAAGLPLTRDEELPKVYWSVPKTWSPGASNVPAEDLLLLARLVRRLPKSPSRSRGLTAIASALRLDRAQAQAVTEAPAAESLEPAVDAQLAAVEDALEQRHALELDYESAGRATREVRVVSVQHVSPGPPARFLATCHRSGALKWFRVDSVHGSKPTKEPFRHAERETVERTIAATVDGYLGEGPLTAVSLVVREPESRWVARNHPKSLTLEPISGGIRLRGEVGAVKHLARWVVSLGGAAYAETPVLDEAVAALAEGALARRRERAG
jgi:predicted DNA-binding transcriptional regulator YafY